HGDRDGAGRGRPPRPAARCPEASDSNPIHFVGSLGGSRGRLRKFCAPRPPSAACLPTPGPALLNGRDRTVFCATTVHGPSRPEPPQRRPPRPLKAPTGPGRLTVS